MMTISTMKKFLSEQPLLQYAIIAHIVLIIAHMIIEIFMNNNPINLYISYCSMASVIAICILVANKAIQFFAQHHKSLMLHHQHVGYAIESFIAFLIMILLFFNQEITAHFITFIIELSEQTHNNKIIVLLIIIGLYFCLKLDHILEKKKDQMNRQSTLKTITFHVITLSLKLLIITGTTIGFLHPVLNILSYDQFKQFDTIIFHFTTTEFFAYIHSMMIILLGLWICFGIYYLYTLYKKRN